MVESGMTEGGKNTASFVFRESLLNTTTQTWSLKLKSNDFLIISE